MPTQSERQQLTAAILPAYLAMLSSESQALVDPQTSLDSDSGSEDSGSTDSLSDAEDMEIPTASDSLLQLLGLLHSCRYLAECHPIPKSGQNLHLLLGDWKHNWPDIFCAFVRMTPECFDALLAITCTDLVFHNQSNIPQIPVEQQLAIALY
ncbi:hypothetical protein EDD16DRAFT_1596463 [Pisolithus croceorrhizus]|nr:hypothetical protein EDD16DRAFT_1596463 [Pisolithus croceorrhizus]KAI6117197.1 hypothetical protein EV401DRAFT_1970407 [Pisolithus croceorrhizus]KAI6161750.1 hypothetical protein EDD17DRAFT_1874432 [Pisolithus thermaeus]